MGAFTVSADLVKVGISTYDDNNKEIVMKGYDTYLTMDEDGVYTLANFLNSGHSVSFTFDTPQVGAKKPLKFCGDIITYDGEGYEDCVFLGYKDAQGEIQPMTCYVFAPDATDTKGTKILDPYVYTPVGSTYVYRYDMTDSENEYEYCVLMDVSGYLENDDYAPAYQVYFYFNEMDPVADPVDYTGVLTVEMNGDDITEGGVASTVKITPMGKDVCTFLLPNLTLPEMGSLGDISLDNVKFETADGITTYTGAQEGMKLMNGALTANVNLTGTVEEGEANMVIDVVWINGDTEVPIKCTFKGNDPAGIHGVVIDNANAPVELYNLNGVRVNENGVAPGLYIRRQGNDVKKVIVR